MTQGNHIIMQRKRVYFYVCKANQAFPLFNLDSLLILGRVWEDNTIIFLFLLYWLCSSLAGVKT